MSLSDSENMELCIMDFYKKNFNIVQGLDLSEKTSDPDWVKKCKKTLSENKNAEDFSKNIYSLWGLLREYYDNANDFNELQKNMLNHFVGIYPIIKEWYKSTQNHKIKTLSAFDILNYLIDYSNK